MATPMQDPRIFGRTCGTCSLCCKVMEITALNKPRGVWCYNCNPRIGCTVYADKPNECSKFYCGYLTNPDLGEEWKPDHSRIVISSDLDGRRLWVNVDPQRPDAWKKEPYYSKIKQWSKLAAKIHKVNRNVVVVSVGWRMYVIFPDRDVDLGVTNKDEYIITNERMTPRGVQWGAFKIHKDDPRAEHFGVAVESRKGAEA